MASITSEIASSSSLPKYEYDVFLSFRGEDTRNNFIDHLYTSMHQKGIWTFKDERFERGTTISTELFNAIEKSKLAIIVLSRNFASSSWCLDELVKIVKCREETRQTVLPIFYGVDPSDVRNQRGSFAQAFAKHEVCIKNEERLKSWRAALTRVANLCGWDTRNEYEAMIIQRVIENIINKLIRPTNLIISIYPLRYDTCHEYLKLFLQVGSKDVIIVGICGPRRMGKTAIAKDIYYQNFNAFEGSSFLSDVAQNSKQPNGLVYLQEKLLSDILSERDIAIANCTRGMDIIKEKLCSKRVLIVLDGVDDLFQLYVLIGSRNWFGEGSKIIITTREVDLLNDLGVDQILLAQGRPLPPNIEAILEKYQQSCHIVAGFQEYIQSLYNMRNDRVRYLENCLLKERQENAVQAPPTG